MKKLQQVDHGEPSKVVQCIDIDPPKPLGDEILIKMEAAAVHLADIKRFRGEYGFKAKELPLTPGYEGVGRILAVGSGVDEFNVGDRVFPWWGNGTFAEIICAKANLAIPAPDGDAGQLALMLVNGMTAVCLLEDFANLKSGDWIIQNGANSNCGRYLITLAKERGIKTLNLVRRDSLFDELYLLGANKCLVDEEDPDSLAQKVNELTNGAKINIGFDMVAGTATERMARCLNYGGKIVNYGFISKQACVLPFHDLFFNNITLTGMSTGRGLAKRDMHKIRTIYSMLATKISQGDLKAEIAGIYTLDNYAKAFKHAEETGEKRHGKIIFKMNS